MPGVSCQNCIFAQWEGQHQNGCLLNRLDKYENIVVINDDYSGSYRVISNNICTAKRNKEWLSKHPQRPEVAVRRELYPKIQLILLIEKYDDNWRDFLQTTDFSDYTDISILLFDLTADAVGVSKSVRATHSMHQCYPANHPTLPNIECHINNMVNPDCQFYLLVNNPFNQSVEKWPDKVDHILNDECKSIYMILYHENYNNFLVYIPLHIYVGGYGTQNIEEKVEIYCMNNNKEELMYWFEDVFNESTNT